MQPNLSSFLPLPSRFKVQEGQQGPGGTLEVAREVVSHLGGASLCCQRAQRLRAVPRACQTLLFLLLGFRKTEFCRLFFPSLAANPLGFKQREINNSQ